MKTRYAEFPFLDEAREAVATAEITIEEILSDGENPIVARGLERVRQTIETGEVGASEVIGWVSQEERNRINVLSYPIARILVSALNSQAIIEQYAYGEAAYAVTLLQEGKTETDIEFHDLLHEFEFDFVVESASDMDTTYYVDLGDYLTYLPNNSDDEWLLQARAVDKGQVPVSTDEMYTLLEEAIASRVMDGLPLEISDSLLDGLESELADLRRLIQDFSLPRNIDVVIPELFPPGIDTLFEAVANDERLTETERFILFTFLARAGLTYEEIVALYDEVPPVPIIDQARRILDNGFPPPNYQAVVDAGICKSSKVDTGHHPLLVYQNRIEQADLDQYTDWRETIYQAAQEKHLGD